MGDGMARAVGSHGGAKMWYGRCVLHTCRSVVTVRAHAGTKLCVLCIYVSVVVCEVLIAKWRVSLGATAVRGRKSVGRDPTGAMQPTNDKTPLCRSICSY